MPQIELVKQSGESIYINFDREDNPDGSFNMKILGVEIRHHNEPGNDYDYLWFPSADDQPGEEKLRISLLSPLELDNLHMPFNGGQTPPAPPDTSTEVTVKLTP